MTLSNLFGEVAFPHVRLFARKKPVFDLARRSHSLDWSHAPVLLLFPSFRFTEVSRFLDDALHKPPKQSKPSLNYSERCRQAAVNGNVPSAAHDRDRIGS